MSDERADRNESSKSVSWPSLWKAIVSVGGLILMFHQAIFAQEVNLIIVIASMAMMGFPVARWLDKM